MKKLVALTGLIAAGCGGGFSFQSVFPADGRSGGGTAPAVGAYVAATTGLRSTQSAGLNVATGAQAIEALIDGDATVFKAKGVVSLGWENYVSGTREADVRVWQMQDAANATETFNALPTETQGLHKAQTWTTLAVGQAGRIADMGDGYWVNARQGAIIIDVLVTPRDDTSKADAQAFAAAIASKVP